MSNIAIYFHPDGYETVREDLKGRHVAGESFLVGFLRHSAFPEFFCYAENADHAAGFFRLAKRHAPGRPAHLIPQARQAGLAGVGGVFVPGANIEQFAWERRRAGQRAYSLCGVTHTTAEYPPMYGALLTAPIQPWDALICTSDSARSSLEAILLPYADYLRHRLGATQIPMPRLPVIPLGIDTAAFRRDDTVREAERRRLGIGPEDIAVLYVGRLSSHAKAHPIPMFLALQKAAQGLGRRLHLVQAGWFAHPEIAKAYEAAAKRCCPDVNVICIDGRPAAARTGIWSLADIFTSLADNVQETFGLTPVEAMAAGLPGVVSDWNGYRETVRDGIDGFRVPTLLPPAGAAQDLADAYSRGHDNYDYYVGRAGQIAAVDIEQAAAAYRRLASDSDLRRRMGAAARTHAVTNFDWAAIIPRYRALWDQLADLRRQAQEIAPWPGTAPNPPQSSPLWPDPTVMFAAYPSARLEGGDRLVRTPEATGSALTALASEPLNSLAVGMMSPLADLALALEMALPPAGVTVDGLLARLPPERRLSMARSLVHLLKFGLLRRA